MSAALKHSLARQLRRFLERRAAVLLVWRCNYEH
jgi:hypothetical protein